MYAEAFSVLQIKRHLLTSKSVEPCSARDNGEHNVSGNEELGDHLW